MTTHCQNACQIAARADVASRCYPIVPQQPGLARAAPAGRRNVARDRPTSTSVHSRISGRCPRYPSARHVRWRLGTYGTSLRRAGPGRSHPTPLHRDQAHCPGLARLDHQEPHRLPRSRSPLPTGGGARAERDSLPAPCSRDAMPCFTGPGGSIPDPGSRRRGPSPHCMPNRIGPRETQRTMTSSESTCASDPEAAQRFLLTWIVTQLDAAPPITDEQARVVQRVLGDRNFATLWRNTSNSSSGNLAALLEPEVG
jgi:hypothetical protein